MELYFPAQATIDAPTIALRDRRAKLCGEPKWCRRRYESRSQSRLVKFALLALVFEYFQISRGNHSHLPAAIFVQRLRRKKLQQMCHYDDKDWSHLTPRKGLSKIYHVP